MRNDTSTVTITTTEYDFLKTRTAELERDKSELEALVKYYEEQFRLAKHKQYSPSSEKTQCPEQLNLFDEAENTADPDLPEPVLEEITYKRRKRKGKREDDLSGLPVEIVEYSIPEEERIAPAVQCIL